MKVFLDGDELMVDGSSLGAALAAGSTSSLDRGRIIVEVWADGEPAPEADLTSPPDREPYATELRLVSAEPKSLVRTVLLDVSEALDSTRETQRQAADHLQVGETSQALQELAEAIRAWETVRRAVGEGCALMDISTTRPDPAESEAGADVRETLNADLVDDLAVNLTSVKDALGREDWPVLSDLLSFDLDEQVDRWQEELNRLADVIKAK